MFAPAFSYFDFVLDTSPRQNANKFAFALGLFVFLSSIAAVFHDMEIVYHIKPFAELSVGELHAAASLRERVFYLEQHVTTLDADEKDPFSFFLWAECEGQTVGFLRMIPRGIAYAEPSIGRVCVARTYRRRGICRQMVSRAIGYMVREWRAEAIRISAQSYLIPFYESFGFEVVSDEYLEAGIPHKKMLIRLDREHGREA